jgi:hypothetical protein
MAWLEMDRHGRLRIAFKYYDRRTYRQMGHRNLTMLIRHYWRWINPGETQPGDLGSIALRCEFSNAQTPRARDLEKEVKRLSDQIGRSDKLTHRKVFTAAMHGGRMVVR